MSTGDNDGTDETYGGYFEAKGTGTRRKYGIYSYASGATAFLNATYGVYGESYQIGDGAGYGGYFIAGGAGTGMGGDVGVYGEVLTNSGIGVEGRASGTGSYAMVSTGDFLCTGAKSAAVKVVKDDWRLVYCQESPEIWFEDFGEGYLHNGRAHVELEPVFLRTVTISEDHPMKVFVQLDDDCNGVYVKRGQTGFDVIELNNGASSASFTYRVVAKRQGYEDVRLKKLEERFNPDRLIAESDRIRQMQEGKRKNNVN
jgi:hypothetical protein